MRPLAEITKDVFDETGGPPNVERLATEVLGHNRREAAGCLFQTLKGRPSEAAIRGIVPLLSELAGRDEGWRRDVLRSLQKRGRCPGPLRKPLRAMLSGGGKAVPQNLAISAMVQEELKAKPYAELAVGLGRTTRIKMGTEATSMMGLPALLNALVRCHQARRIVLDFSDLDHVYIPGLTVVSAWLLSRRIIPAIESASSGTQRYLDRIGFVDIVAGRRQEGMVDSEDDGYAVAIERIESGKATEGVASRIVDICNRHGYIGKGDRNALVIAFAEIIENVQRHAGGDRFALVAAQFYPRNRKLNVAVVDTGMGIAESFETGRNQMVRRRMASGESPVRLATAPLITSKPMIDGVSMGHAGYGLYVVSELAVRNGGTFRITSGPSSLTLYRKISGLGYDVVRKCEEATHASWQGTIIGLILDLNNLMPIGEVYNTLPIPPGYEEEDFFHV